jgi:hypothetical protein
MVINGFSGSNQEAVPCFGPERLMPPGATGLRPARTLPGEANQIVAAPTKLTPIPMTNTTVR